VVDARIDRQVGKRELLDRLGALVEDPRLQQQPGGAIRPEAVAVAKAVLRLEHDDLHRATANAIFTNEAKRVIARQRLLLLRRQRREHVAKRPRLDADQLRVRVVAADLAVVADDLARRSVEIHELREFAVVLVKMRDARRFDARADLVDDRPHVIEPACGLRGAGKPLHRVVGARTRRDEGQYKYGR